ncbi:hypothetical protein HDU97_003554 [Phlyctochytrium planicorne]|nr:hypothetical protein HDU97_003554 [Phlyctochytrium planicorne]
MQVPLVYNASHPMENVPYTSGPAREEMAKMGKDALSFWGMASLNAVADALTMQRANFAETWDLVRGTKEKFEKQLEVYCNGRFRELEDKEVEERLKGKRVRRFMCLAFFPNPRSGKKKVKRGGVGTQNEDAVVHEEDPEYLIGGSIACQWFVDDRHMAWRFCTSLGQFGIHVNSFVPSMLMSILAQITTDIAANLPSNLTSPRYDPMPVLQAPIHSWGFAVWGEGKERTRKSLLPDALRHGTKDLEGYKEAYGFGEEEMRELLRDLVISREDLGKREIFVSNWKETLSLVKSVEGRKIK